MSANRDSLYFNRQNTLENNRLIWDQDYAWTQDGDEWALQAALCNQPYEDRKRGLIETFILPFVDGDTAVMEIAPGHGRWSETIVPRAKRSVLVDLSANCISFCKNKFTDHDNVKYFVTDGASLPPDENGSVDLVFSYDAFVHMEPHVIDSYLSHAARVLRPGGKAVIHHASRRHSTLWLGFLLGLGKVGRKAYQLISMGQKKGGDGWKSNVSGELFRKMAESHGFRVVSQTDSWGDRGQYKIADMCVTEMIVQGPQGTPPPGVSPGTSSSNAS